MKKFFAEYSIDGKWDFKFEEDSYRSDKNLLGPFNTFTDAKKALVIALSRHCSIFEIALNEVSRTPLYKVADKLGVGK